MLRVRSRVIGGWLLAAGLLATTVVGACAEKKGALMLAITTDMKAPKDLNAVAVSITTNGLVKASFIGRVTPQGEIVFPGTLAIIEPDDKNATIRIRVMAFQNQKPRVIRDVRTTAPPDHRTALLRVPLNFVNDGKVAGDPLPAGLLPDAKPGTERFSPPADATSSTGTPAGDAGMVGTKDVLASGGDFDFMLSYQPKDCLNPQDETIINGECHDSFIDSSTLPDFDAAELGDSTGMSGACFDLAKCFAGAIDTGQRTGAGTNDGGDVGPADAGTADSGTPVDAGPKPFKDFRPATLDFDAVGCTYKLNGADPTRLNIAIVTPDTGECVRAGECYIPFDRGATGWTDDGSGTVHLPEYLCRFLTAKGLHLATSTDVCAAKVDTNPICTPKEGDDAGIFPAGGDGGGQEIPFSIPEDFATSVAIYESTLSFASQSRQGFVSLGDPYPKPQPIQGVAVAGSAHLPWRFGLGAGGVALVNGSTTGWVLGPQGMSQPVKFPAPIIDVAGTTSALVWAANQGASMPSFFLSPPDPPVQGEIQIAGVTSLLSTSIPDHVIVGDSAGSVRLCNVAGVFCGPPSALNGGRVDSMVLSGPSSGYALTANGIYSITADSGQGTANTQRLLSDQTAFAGVQEGALYFAHSVAWSGSCLFYSSYKGVEYLIEQDGIISSSGVIVAAAGGKPILGIAVGPDPAHGGKAVYYSVFAPRDMANGLNGGGIFRAPLPVQCNAAGGADAGVAKCSSATCPMGCCSLAGNTCLPFAQQKPNMCGSFGNACMDCGVSGACVASGGNGGQCG